MERERITISIKKNLLNSIDSIIDGVSVRNRSHAIETLASKALNTGGTKNAVILIGGEEALNKIPSVEKNLKQLAKSGYEKVYIAVGFLGDKIKQQLGSGENFGLELVYIEDGEGSGGAIESLKKVFSSTFLVFYNADFLSKLSLDKLIDFHNRHNTEATIVTNNLPDLEGLYILEPAIFDRIPKGFSMLETDIFPKLFEEGKAIIYPALD